MDFSELIKVRRSRRSYTGEVIPKKFLDEIIEAGLLAPTGRNLHPAEVVVVRDKAMLERLALAKTSGSTFIKDADAALVVIGDTVRSDTWVEDCSIMMAYMQLAAEEKGIGNCWVQIRGRLSQMLTKDGNNIPSGVYVCDTLGIPASYEVLAILALGQSREVIPIHGESEIDWEHSHKEKY